MSKPVYLYTVESAPTGRTMFNFRSKKKAVEYAKVRPFTKAVRWKNGKKHGVIFETGVQSTDAHKC